MVPRSRRVGAGFGTIPQVEGYVALAPLGEPQSRYGGKLLEN